MKISGPFTSTRWRVNSSGHIYRATANVGIGTSSPSEKLVVDGVLGLGSGQSPTSEAGIGKVYVDSSGYLHYLDPSGNDIIVGEASDTTPIGDPPAGESYSSGFFDDWTSVTEVGTAMFDISTAFSDLAPDKAGLLTSQTLTLAGTTEYSAKLPSGLSANWGSYTPGQTITTLIVDNTYTLSSPSTSTIFRAGKASDNPGSAGQCTHVLDGAAGDIHDISVDGIGSTGNMEITALDVYNTFWLKANARINYTHSTEGRKTHAISHTEAGTSNTATLYYDDVNTAPSFSVAMSHSVQSEVLKYMSGIAYYTTGTVLRATYTAASGIFQKAYHPTQVSRIEVTGASNLTVNPPAVPAVADTFAVSGATGDMTLSVANQASNSPQITARLYKPNGATTSSSEALARRVCTYGTVSTTTIDYFYDEDKRLVLGTDTAWTSTDALTNGNAQVLNGSLIHGADGDYGAFSGDQEYQRRISKTSASNGTLTLTGLTYTDISPYGTGDVNVLLWLETDDIYFDLGRVVGDNNGDGSGDSRANSLGSQVSGSGTSVVFSFLTYTTGDNSHRYRVIIIYRATGYSITHMTGV